VWTLQCHAKTSRNLQKCALSYTHLTHLKIAPYLSHRDRCVLPLSGLVTKRQHLCIPVEPHSAGSASTSPCPVGRNNMLSFTWDKISVEFPLPNLAHMWPAEWKPSTSHILEKKNRVKARIHNSYLWSCHRANFKVIGYPVAEIQACHICKITSVSMQFWHCYVVPYTIHVTCLLFQVNECA